MIRFFAIGFALAIVVTGVCLTSSPALAQTMTLREIRYNLKKGRTAFRRQQYERASQLFFEVVENGAESPKLQKNARIQLARALLRQNLHLVALTYVQEVLQATPPKSRSQLFVIGMRGLVTIADAVNDESMIMNFIIRIKKLIKKLPPDQDPVEALLTPSARLKNYKWWPSFYKKVAYLMGRFYFIKERYSYAKRFLSLLRSDAPIDIYTKSVYMRAIIDSRDGKFKKAIQQFQQLLTLTGPKDQQDLLDNVKEEAQYGIARTLYARGRRAQVQHEDYPKRYSKERYTNFYRQALVEYNKLSKKRGIFQAQMLFETAYTYFMMDQFHFSLGQLLALQSPYYTTGFFPELQILRALIYFKTCKYEDTKQTVERFRKQYEPLQKKIRTLISYKTKKRWRQQYYEYYLDQAKKLRQNAKTDIPPSVIVQIGNEKSLRTYETLLKKIQLELGIIRSKSSSWRESNIGKRLLASAIELRSSLRRQAGNTIALFLRSSLLKDISAQLNQSRIIQLETLQNQKRELLRYAEGGGIEQDEFRYTIVTEQSHIYWPYQGEYWRDEVGHYRQFIQGECKQ